MLAEPLARALAAARAAQREDGWKATRTLHLSPAGTPLVHKRVAELAAAADATAYVLLAGRYEGIDERRLDREVDEEIAVGDFVVSGGELPALMVIDAIVRQRPGVLNDAESAAQDSFAAGLPGCRRERRSRSRRPPFRPPRGDPRVAPGSHWADMGAAARFASGARVVEGGEVLISARARGEREAGGWKEEPDESVANVLLGQDTPTGSRQQAACIRGRPALHARSTTGNNRNGERKP
jgi:hypothetical protein